MLPEEYDFSDTDARDPGCAILALLLVGFWAAVAAGVWLVWSAK